MTLLLDALAAFRLTRLVTADTLTERPRDALTARSDFAANLLGCPWCSGFWAAVGVVAAARLVPRQWAPVRDALAFAAVVGLLSEIAETAEAAR